MRHMRGAKQSTHQMWRQQCTAVCRLLLTSEVSRWTRMTMTSHRDDQWRHSIAGSTCNGALPRRTAVAIVARLCHTRAGDLKDMHGTLGSNPIEYPETANTRPRAPAHWCATSPRPASQNPIIGRPGSERPTQSQHLSSPSSLPLPPPTDTPPRFTGEPDTRGRDSPPPHDSLYGQSLRVIACAGG